MELSQETRTKLDSITITNIQSYSEICDEMRTWIKKLDLVILAFEKNEDLSLENKNQVLLNLQMLCEYQLLIGLIWLDITSAFRIYLNAKEKYEVIYAAKQLIITINEGYKRIYHFIIPNEKGDAKLKHRNNSFWIKEVGGLIKQELPHMLDQFDEISLSLNSYFELNLENIKAQRDLGIHYPENPSKAFDMLINLDIETIAVKIIPFMDILTKMTNFTKQILFEYNRLQNQKTYDIFNKNIEKIENLKLNFKDKPQIVDILTDFQKKIVELNMNPFA